ncbi:hypothetical protein [Lactobacillus kisonensis]|uniref:Uncharacterized protein n=1 Tax=Lentilactobacillus kisonensis F0435 TaxID=797516 RepID=H1LFE2_9LACO|nr:hypothetical protein HMPREF9104_01318 [Lentilactobacillus kisonensis F0435]
MLNAGTFSTNQKTAMINLIVIGRGGQPFSLKKRSAKIKSPF